METIKSSIIIVLFSLIFWGCSSVKHVPEGRLLLNKVEFHDIPEELSGETWRNQLLQQPNSKIFGLVRFPLGLYSLSGLDSSKWINRTLQSWGEAPVVLEKDLVESSRSNVEKFLSNKGFLDGKVEASIDTTTKKKATVNYYLIPNEPYRIVKYQIKTGNNLIDSLLRFKEPPLVWWKKFFVNNEEQMRSKVYPNMLFDRYKLNQQRDHYAYILRNNGYFNVRKEDFAYRAERMNLERKINLDLVLNPNQIPDSLFQQAYLNRVTIIDNFDLFKKKEVLSLDTLSIHDINIVYANEKRNLRPSVLRRRTLLIPGNLYREQDLEQTYSNLSSLSALQSTLIRFNPFFRHDSLLLDCNIYTIPSRCQTISLEVEGTNSSGDLGAALGINYRHRNLFGGSELFTTQLRGAYESISFSQDHNFIEYGIESRLTYPSFIFPLLSNKMRNQVGIQTEFRLSYNFQSRPQYDRILLSGGVGYVWNIRNDIFTRHNVKLLDVDFVHLPFIDPNFKASLPEITRVYNYSDQLIVGGGYSLLLSDNTMGVNVKNSSLRISFESAGNVLSLLSKVNLFKKDAYGNYKLVGVPYHQFIKADLDFSKTFMLNKRNRVATHLALGIGFPYGNSHILPFERRYFAGGANGVRGWSVRKLGPGSMPKNGQVEFYHQSGDLNFLFTTEYRSKVFWKLELATYVDVGNIWTIRSYPDQPKGQFKIQNFYRELAASYGLGFRFDFDFFLIRFDTGFKIYDPQAPAKDRWAVLNPNFSDNFAWHFAVGYPF